MAVVVAMLGVVVPAIYTSVTVVRDSVSATDDRAVATASAQTIMNDLSTELRAAQPVMTSAAQTVASAFSSAGSNAVAFYASPYGSASTAPDEYSVTLSPFGTTGLDDVIETVVAPASSGSYYSYNGNGSQHVDGGLVASSSVIFTYYSAAGAVLDGGTEPLPDAYLPQIAEVGISLAVRTQRSNQATHLQTTVFLATVADEAAA